MRLVAPLAAALVLAVASSGHADSGLADAGKQVSQYDDAYYARKAVRYLRENGVPDDVIIGAVREALRGLKEQRRNHSLPPTHQPDR